MTVIYVVVGFAVGWVVNILAMGGTYGGFYTPAGSPVSGVGNQVPGFAFSFIASTLVASVIAYRLSVGPERFSREARAIPADILAAFRGGSRASRAQLLLGLGTALLATAVLGPSIAFLLTIASAVAFAPLLRPIATGLVLFVYGLVARTLLPGRTGQPGSQAVMVGLAGAGAGFLVGWVLPTSPGPPGATVALAVLAIGVAVVMSRGTASGGGGAMVVLAIGGGLVAALAAHPGVALADDGGFSECGNLGLLDWLSKCKGSGGVLGNSLIGALGSAVGSALGAGLGASADGLRRQGWQAALDGGFDGFVNQFQHLGMRDVVDPLSVLAALGGAPREALLTGDSRAVRSWVDSGNARSLYEDFAADPIEFAQKHGIGQWLTDFPNENHSPITQDDMTRYAALYGQYQQAVDGKDDYNANRLKGMLLATTIWLGAQVIDPEVAAEGVLSRLGTRTAAGQLERVVASGVVAAERKTFAHIPGEFTLNAEQRLFLERDMLALEQILDANGNPIQTLNTTQRVVFDDGGRAILKPESGVGADIGAGSVGTKYSREVGTYITDQHLGFNQVPTTVVVDHPVLGRSSAQLWANGTPVQSSGALSAADQQMAAVRDYITLEADRHLGNVLQSPDGRLIAIDHGESFPTGLEAPVIRSEFVYHALDQNLDPAVLASVRAVDRTALGRDLLNAGLTQQQVNGALARLDSIATQGRLTTPGLGRPGDFVTIFDANMSIHQALVP